MRKARHLGFEFVVLIVIIFHVGKVRPKMPYEQLAAIVPMLEDTLI
jgi:hypothetical protein